MDRRLTFSLANATPSADEWQCTALTLTHSDNNAAFVCLVLLKAAINALCLFIVRANVTTKVCAVDFDMAF